MTLRSNTDEARTTQQPDILKRAVVLAAIKTKPPVAAEGGQS